MAVDTSSAGALIAGRSVRNSPGGMMARLKKPKMFDVLLTRGCRIPGPDGDMVNAGPDVTKDSKTGKKRVGEPMRVSVLRRLGNQIVQSGRGFWADGKPEQEQATDEPEETAGGSGSGRGRGRGAPKE